MADRILSRVLAGLERIYKFPGSQKGAPSEFELDLPIQPVHDVSSMSTMGSGEGRQNGFWVANWGISHSIVGAITISPDLFNPGTAGNGYPALVDARDQSAWVFDFWGYGSNNSNLNYVVCSHKQGSRAVGPSNGVGGPQVGKVLFYSNYAGIDNILMPTNGYSILPRYPFRVLRNEGGGGVDSHFRILSLSDTGGTLITTFQALFWLGPKGVTPPVFGK